MIELDAQLTSDGAVVVLHDDTLERTTDGLGPLVVRTLAEVRRLDAGRWFDPAFAGERVPTLADVLAAVPITFNVELKGIRADDLEARALAVVEEAGALERVVFSSFEPKRLIGLRALTQRAALAVLWSGPKVGDALRLAERVGARALHVRNDRRGIAAIAAGLGAGLEVRVWTVNSPADLASLVDAGASGIFTDFPERFLHLAPPE
jgi:glycerophosphoryl diester phosphodiesterase